MCDHFVCKQCEACLQPEHLRPKNIEWFVIEC